MEEVFLSLVRKVQANNLPTENKSDFLSTGKPKRTNNISPRKPRASSLGESNPNVKKMEDTNYQRFAPDSSFEDVDLREISEKGSKKKSKKEKDSKKSTLATSTKGTWRKLGKTFSQIKGKSAKTKFNTINKMYDGFDEQLADFWCSKEIITKDWKEFEVFINF